MLNELERKKQSDRIIKMIGDNIYRDEDDGHHACDLTITPFGKDIIKEYDYDPINVINTIEKCAYIEKFYKHDSLYDALGFCVNPKIFDKEIEAQDQMLYRLVLNHPSVNIQLASVWNISSRRDLLEDLSKKNLPNSVLYDIYWFLFSKDIYEQKKYNVGDSSMLYSSIMKEDYDWFKNILDEYLKFGMEPIIDALEVFLNGKYLNHIIKYNKNKNKLHPKDYIGDYISRYGNKELKVEYKKVMV